MSQPVLISSEQIETSTANAVAYRVLYHSYDVRGRATTSSGLVIVPAAPGQDRKVLTWTHGTTGSGDAACPSSGVDPAADLRTYFDSGSTTNFDYGIPGLQSFIDDGWIVVATDYQGLGTPGLHHYTINRTNALDGINIVKAAREMNLGAGTKVGCIGWSQGGGTAAAIAELDPADYGDLELVGTVSLSPGVPTMGLEHPTGMGAALSGGDIAPDGHLIMNLAAFADAYPEKVSLDSMLSPLGIKIWNENWNVQPVHHLSDIFARTYLHEGAIMNIDQSKLGDWLAVMKDGSAGKVKPICPVHVFIDSQRGGTVIPVPWQQGYVDAVKALGGDIVVTDCPNDDHFALPKNNIAAAKEWLEPLFN